MDRQIRSNNSVYWFMSELTSRIVADSGIPSDRFHIGKMILRSLKEEPDFMLQIDGATGKSETAGSVLRRSIQCAAALRNIGIQKGDLMALMAPNHLDVAIPYYAALYLGIIIAPVDRTLSTKDVERVFDIDRPRIVFCQSDKADDIQSVCDALKLDTHIITFDERDDTKSKYLSFSDFLAKSGDNIPFDDFRATDFNAEDTTAIIISTSGTTGNPKAAALTHKNFAESGPGLWCKFKNFPKPTRMVFVASTLQWLSAIVHYNFAPIVRVTRLQSSLPVTQQLGYRLINTYRPTHMCMSTTMLASLLRPGDRDHCDLSSFELIGFGGSTVPLRLIEEVKKTMPQTAFFQGYGMTETATYFTLDSDHQPAGSCGKLTGAFQYRLINVETQDDVEEANVTGELWLKGPSIFKEYYNNPTATKEAFTEDGWFKTGDLLYRDEDWNFYFVDRIKLLMKYKMAHIYPAEVENVINKHPGVLDVAVTSVPDDDGEDLVVACVVRDPGYTVTAQNIKDLVKENLSDAKQLRGGVVFMDELPTTVTTKLDRKRLKAMVQNIERE